MGLLDLFRLSKASTPTSTAPQAYGDSYVFEDLKDPRLAAFLSAGRATTSGVSVDVETALMNPAVFRSVSLISYAIGMLPLHLIDDTTKEKARDHPLFRLLHRRPNNWQSAFDFRSLMQLRALVKGDGYALIVRSRGRVISLIPLDPDRVTPTQNADWSVTYKYRRADGGEQVYQPEEIFHLRGLSTDGIRGISLVKQARNAIGLALAAELATGRIYKNGSFVDGALVVPPGVKLSQQQIERLRDSWNARYSGADNAGKTPLLEEGLEYKVVGASAKDAQSNETRARQVEEIARVFGVPRPLLMVDETSWGSGIEALGKFFVDYALGPWFEAWQQAAERSLLTEDEVDQYAIKFNPGALLRGSVKDQGDFFAKALGSGGAPAWMTQNQVREVLDMPRDDDPKSDRLNPGATGLADSGGNENADGA